jgi:hypothetical protein
MKTMLTTLDFFFAEKTVVGSLYTKISLLFFRFPFDSTVYLCMSAIDCSWLSNKIKQQTISRVWFDDIGIGIIVMGVPVIDRVCVMDHLRCYYTRSSC